ncbi:MAG: capsule biosynthesis protein [Betaproteobacteria bacterium]
MQRLLISTLAEYQTTFWVEVGVYLTAAGHDVTFLSFDDRSTEMLRARGCRVHSATSIPALPDNQVEHLFSQFGIDRLNHWLSHERFAFDIGDGAVLRRKLAAALQAADDACKDVLSRGPAVMIQELGGFLSVIGAFHAARANGMDNWFIEPSFFRGRLFFLRNSFMAPRVPDDHSWPVPDELRHYLDDTLRSGAIVVPQKDRHQYTTAWKKIVNLRNARRLIEKLVDKHWHGKRQEFGHIGSHVRTHARMLWNSRRLRSCYTPLDVAGRFVYYPLHVPGDMALTLRTPHLLDQLSLVDQICRSVPASHRVAIKEHPAMVGAVDASRLLGLKRRYDNLVVLPPSTNNYAVLRRCDAVVSINSKSGAEGALIGKPVIVLGDAFYTDSPVVRTVDRVQDLPSALANALVGGAVGAESTVVERYLAAVWKRSHPGELYVPEPTNVARFSQSLLTAMAA